ncbi:SDR family NAD(P)-dependent oxidoreductase [Nocardia sp. NPDC046473]|uniref:SDR family NAD(P)-dependent oxidoreductase n=1 Tax=Nocardia sp. NPDC046473 TaxID=3155733 RepID=UPI0033FC5FBA
MARLAIVGMACRYPDATSPAQLWENVLAGRRAFRPIPDTRLNRADYYSADPAAPDRHYASHAAVLEGWAFDRRKYRISGTAFKSTDIAHWLALDTAAAALDDAGFPAGEGLDRARTGVVVGNTLTGDMSRANATRLRWPYVRRTLANSLERKGWTPEEIAEFIATYEVDFKAGFPPISEDSLAGGLANTIAGRICNHFDLGGGGYTVDGACASSLLSVTTAGNALAAGQLDAVVVGGVDISIDPFELVGFAKTGALATSTMRVYDEASNGFWPGEGCGMLVLVREDDALARGLRSYATIAGWGVSSDGRGSITRPDAAGHLVAIERAYRMAGFAANTVDYLEGHGTGTVVGDRAELEVFGRAVSGRDSRRKRVGVGAIKGNIGHTKAAAGIAALIKTVLAVHHATIPPITGNHRPHPLLATTPLLELPRAAVPWPTGDSGFPVDEPSGSSSGTTADTVSARRAGMSALGFGGINAHIVVESRQPPVPIGRELGRRLAHSRQDCELFVLSESTPQRLEARLRETSALAAQCSFAELGDLSTALARGDSQRRYKAAVVAFDQAQAAGRLTDMANTLAAGQTTVFMPEQGQFLGGPPRTAVRIGLLFPGQGVSSLGDGGAAAQRFEVVADLYQATGRHRAGTTTKDAQPRIVTASLAGLRLLRQAGVEAVGCVGHSLGELTALHWAGVFNETQVVAAAAVRGEAMQSAAATSQGTMASITAASSTVAALLNGGSVVIAGYNGPRQTVVSGLASDIDAVVDRARAAGLHCQEIAVSHAFHSPLVGAASATFRTYLDKTEIRPVERPGVYSTVTGAALTASSNVIELLERQILAPVQFAPALTRLAASCDLLIEVGPGRLLSGLATQVVPAVPVVAMDTDSDSLVGTLQTLAACYAIGANPDLAELTAERFCRAMPSDKQFTFIESPCERAPDASHLIDLAPAETEPTPVANDQEPRTQSALYTLRTLLAERTELPLTDITPSTHPLDDLHLSSITITQVVGDAVRMLGLRTPEPTTNVATATVGHLAESIEEAARIGDVRPRDELTGIDAWTRSFVVEHVARPRRRTLPNGDQPGTWEVFAAQDDPLVAVLLRQLETAPLGDGVLLLCGDGNVQVESKRMLAAGQAAIQQGNRLVVVGTGRNAAALAKTVHLEKPAVRTTVVHLSTSLTPDTAAELVLAEVLATTAFVEVDYDSHGIRAEPVLRELETGEQPLPVGSGDVVVVTGGAHGITVECALAMASQSGCALALIGRRDAADAEVADNLARVRGAGITANYYRADVTDRTSVAGAIADIARDLGPVTGILHGAAVNAPALISALTPEEFAATVAAKVDGLAHIVEAVAASELRLIIGFGSIIGRAGLRGEAHYAVANDWLRNSIDVLDQRLPNCRCLTIEWSIWAGAGMGERLGVLNALTREGIDPIPTDTGVEIMLDLLRTPSCPSAVVVLGRTGELPTITFDDVELPLLRFLERPRLHFPGIELIAEADLSISSDPYLADHQVSGDILFPAVMGMEAMAQAAVALLGDVDSIELRSVEFLRPIVVPGDGVTTVRTVALRQGSEVRIAIRSATTAFQTDHFRAVCLASEITGSDADRVIPADLGDLVDDECPPMNMDVENDFYHRIMFHGRRFRSVRDYRHISAQQCIAEIQAGAEPWFAATQPGQLVLGDPAARDAFMHAIQVCVPDATLLPTRIGLVREIAGSADFEKVELTAVERSSGSGKYVYDVVVRDQGQNLVAIWEQLELTAVTAIEPAGGWPPELVAPVLTRRLNTLLPEPLQMAFVRDADHDPASVETRAGAVSRRMPSRRVASERALAAALGHRVSLHHRADGRPELPGKNITVSHGTGLTLGVVAERPIGCDLEPVQERTEDQWRDLLGMSGVALAQMCSSAGDESFTTAATRVWSAREAVTKLGVTVSRPRLTFESRDTAPGWLAMRHGRDLVWSVVVTLALPSPVTVVVAVAQKG